MTDRRLILGIETSCDETAAAVVARDPTGAGTILSNVVRAQIEAHAPYSGVVPEIAARAHAEICDHVVDAAMKESAVEFAELNAVAATAGPGLIGGVMVGLLTAKSIALATGRDFVAVNHLEAHVLTPRLTHGVAFPYLVMLASGGHSQWVLVRGLSEYERLATTIDDAIGEAFDKSAKLLGLGFPGGPAVENAAKNGDPTRFSFPKPLTGRPTFDISLSGLKTAIRQEAEALQPLSDGDISDLCASFQATVTEIITDRTARILDRLHADGVSLTAIVASGGVAANQTIRNALEDLAAERSLPVAMPPMHLCTDNGAMIAWAALEHHAAGRRDPLDFPARSRWPLDEKAAPKLGFGRAGVKV
ncbi:MAG: tRNA (adenosine(37)-N6)-threonylcarbamoyltransferase complex transferase subunit TsaD [Pseudomonadota bacterium]